MNPVDLRTTVRQIVEAVLRHELPADKNLARKDVPGWDSLKHVEVLFGIEEQFGITLDEDAFAMAQDIEAIAASVETALAARLPN